MPRFSSQMLGHPLLWLGVTLVVVIVGYTWMSGNSTDVTSEPVKKLSPESASNNLARVEELLKQESMSISDNSDEIRAQEYIAIEQKESRINPLFLSADQHMEAGSFVQPAGANAWDDYYQILEIDPGNLKAENGLIKIRNLLIDNAEIAIEVGNLENAESWLVQLDVIQPGDVIQDELRADIRTQIELEAQARLRQQKEQERHQKIETSLAQAREERGSIPINYNKIKDLYNRVLELDPGNTRAIAGMETLVSTILDEAESNLRADNLDKATDLLEQAREMDTGNKRLGSIQLALETRLDQKAEQEQRKAELESIDKFVDTIVMEDTAGGQVSATDEGGIPFATEDGIEPVASAGPELQSSVPETGDLLGLESASDSAQAPSSASAVDTESATADAVQAQPQGSEDSGSLTAGAGTQPDSTDKGEDVIGAIIASINSGTDPDEALTPASSSESEENPTVSQEETPPPPPEAAPASDSAIASPEEIQSVDEEIISAAGNNPEQTDELVSDLESVPQVTGNADAQEESTPDPVLVASNTNIVEESSAEEITQKIRKEKLERGIRAYYDGDYNTSFELLYPLAEEGEARAQFRIGVMYRYGRSVAQNPDLSEKWFTQALPSVLRQAQSGDAWAQTDLGTAYELGISLQQDFERAAYWYRLAAEQDYPGAQTNLGVLYANGEGVDYSRSEAVFWLRKAANQGDLVAIRNLNVMGENL